MKLILFAAAARLAHGADFCVPAACRKLAPGADGFMKNLVGDLECCAPRELPRGVVHMGALREPLESAASHFYFDQALSPNQLPDGGPASFNEWVLTTMGTTEYSTYYWHNYMTRYFSSTSYTNDIG